MEKTSGERALHGATTARWSRLRENIRRTPRPAAASAQLRLSGKLSNNSRGFHLRASGELAPRPSGRDNGEAGHASEAASSRAMPLAVVPPHSTRDVDVGRGDRDELLSSTSAAPPSDANAQLDARQGAKSSLRPEQMKHRGYLGTSTPQSMTPAALASRLVEGTMSLMMHTVGNEFYPTLFVREFFWQAFYPLHLPLYLCVRGEHAAYAQRFLPTIAWFKQLASREFVAAAWNLFFFMFLHH